METIYNIMCAITDLAQTHENPADDLIEVCERFEQFVAVKQSKEEFQSLMARKGRFRYFKSLLESPHVVLELKNRLVKVLLQAFEMDTVVERFVEGGIVKFVHDQIMTPTQVLQTSRSKDAQEALNHSYALLLNRIAYVSDSAFIVSTFIQHGGVNALCSVAKQSVSGPTMYVALQALVDLSIKGTYYKSAFLHITFR